jgi:hypothetical protein
MNDDFLNRFRKSPNPQFATDLYTRINKPGKTISNTYWRLAATLTAGAILVIVLLISSPSLAAFAQNIVNFFIPAELETFSIPLPDRGQGTVVGGSAVWFIAPGCDDPAAMLTYACQIAQAEASVGFDVRQPPVDPQGLAFSQAEADPAIPAAWLVYTCTGCELVITQTHGAADSPFLDTDWSEVPPEAVEPVQINGLPGEYVQGTFVSQDGQSAFWASNAPVQRLRWRDGEMIFELRLSGAVEVVEYLDKEALIDLAESLR